MAINPIVDGREDTHLLERLYRSDPIAFSSHLEQALQTHPRSPILQFWQARFEYPQAPDAGIVNLAAKQILYPLLLCLLTIFLVRAPAYSAVDEVWFYTRFAPLIVIAALIIVLLITLLCLFGATYIQKGLGISGQHVFSRVFGVLLSALAVQFVFDGIGQSGLLP